MCKKSAHQIINRAVPHLEQYADPALLALPQVPHCGLCSTVTGAATFLLPIIPRSLMTITSLWDSVGKYKPGVNRCWLSLPGTVIPESFTSSTNFMDVSKSSDMDA